MRPRQLFRDACVRQETGKAHSRAKPQSRRLGFERCTQLTVADQGERGVGCARYHAKPRERRKRIVEALLLHRAANADEAHRFASSQTT